MRAVLLFFTLLYSTAMLSQSPLDSLKKVWQDETRHDTIRIDALQKFTKVGYLFRMPDSAVYYSNMQLSMADAVNDTKSMIDALATKSVAYIILGKYQEAENSLASSVELCDEIGFDGGKARAYGNYGVLYQEQGFYERAISYFMKSLEIKERLNNVRGIANTNGNIGNIYLSLGDTTRALSHYRESLQMFQKIDDKKGMASCLHNMGDLYLNTGQFEKGKFSLEKSLQLREESGDIRGVASSSNTLGKYYMTKESPDYQKAGELYERSLALNQKMRDTKGIVEVRSSIAAMLFLKKEYTRAAEIYEELLEVVSRTGMRDKEIDLSGSLYKIYKETGDEELALAMFERYVAMKDSVEKNDLQNRLLQQEIQHKYDTKAAADSARNAEQQKVKDAQLAKQEAELDRQQSEQYTLYGGLALITFFALFMVSRFRVTNRQNKVIEEQKVLVEVKNKEMLDSINYARRLQEAILPPQEMIDEHLPKSFIFYRPKDIVAGDFYWMETYAPAPSSSASASESSPKGDLSTAHQFPLEGDTGGKVHKCTYIAAADCTGHGVPGAMVSVVCSNALSKAVIEENITEPAKILDRTRELVIERFQRSGDQIRDGMDIALVKIVGVNDDLSGDQKPPREGGIPARGGNTVTLEYAGANNPLWVVSQSESNLDSESDTIPSNKRPDPPEGGLSGSDNWKLLEVKPDKQPIGKYAGETPFANHKMQVSKGDTVYIFSDGFVDQFGGSTEQGKSGGKKYKIGRFKQFLLSIQDRPMEEQHHLLEAEFEKWKGNLEQVDDVCVIGIRI